MRQNCKNASKIQHWLFFYIPTSFRKQKIIICLNPLHHAACFNVYNKMTKYFIFVPLVCGFPGLADRPLPGRTPPPRTPLNSKSWIVCCRVEWKKMMIYVYLSAFICATHTYILVYVGIVVTEKTGIGLLLNMHLSGEKKNGRLILYSSVLYYI